MTHTPGPWQGRFENGHYMVVGENRVVIRSCRLEDVSVIAAAPEMREALERLVEAAGPQMAEPDSALEFARTVIWKARGKA